MDRAAIGFAEMIPTLRAPASIGALLMLGGLALVYWALTGLGVISGSTPTERAKYVRKRLTGETA